LHCVRGHKRKTRRICTESNTANDALPAEDRINSQSSCNSNGVTHPIRIRVKYTGATTKTIKATTKASSNERRSHRRRTPSETRDGGNLSTFAHRSCSVGSFSAFPSLLRSLPPSSSSPLSLKASQWSKSRGLSIPDQNSKANSRVPKWTRFRDMAVRRVMRQIALFRPHSVA
jgi:hypothetical protein